MQSSISNDQKGKDMSINEDIKTEKNSGEELEENLGENNVVEQERDIEEDILKVFEHPEYAYPMIDVIEEFKKLGYSEAGKAILYAIQDELLYLDSIDEDGTVYIAVVDDEDDEDNEDN